MLANGNSESKHSIYCGSGVRIMRGQVVYVIHYLRSGERILWQQFTDGWLSFRHYGVALDDGTVVHFCGDKECIQNEARIKRTSREEFCQGSCLHIAKEVCYRFSPELVAERALAQVGSNFGGYHVLLNNCEHFANWCACGKKISRQVMRR